MESIYSNIFVNGICREIKNVWESSHSLSGTMIFLFVSMDTMGYLNMETGENKNDSSDFINWVTNFMKTDNDQPYQYNPKDLWAARCAKLHSFSSFSDYAIKHNCKLFGYQDGTEHMCNHEESNLILISAPRLMEDFFNGVYLFIENAVKYPEVKKRIDSRITKVCEQFDIR